MRKNQFVGFRIEKDVWDQFYSMYGKNAATELRELIRKKVAESQS